MTVVGNINVMSTKCWSIAIVAVDGFSMVSVQEHLVRVVQMISQ